MSEYYARVYWQRNNQNFCDNKYSREHRWEFDGGLSVPASPSPHIVPAPMSNEKNVDPEEAFVASISSCHMLFFLSVAAARGYIVDEYDDQAVGVMAENKDGKMAMVKVNLCPRVKYHTDSRPDRAQEEQIHHCAHGLCFIANSVKTEIQTIIRERED